MLPIPLFMIQALPSSNLYTVAVSSPCIQFVWYGQYDSRGNKGFTKIKHFSLLSKTKSIAATELGSCFQISTLDDQVITQ